MEHARARVLPKDAAVIDTIAAARQEDEREIAGLKAEARAAGKEIGELVAEVPF